MPLRIPYASRGLRHLPLLGAFLGEAVESAILPWRHRGADWLGWGAKRSARRARWYAQHSGGRSIQLEDGFLRSWGSGESFPPLSLVVDDVGIYYDSTRPSALERLLASDEEPLAGIAAEVARAKQLLLRHRLSKYNHAPLLDERLLRSGDRQRVLVVDQTAGDLSVVLGGARAETFAAMVAAARAENPGATLYVKTHPEVSAGRKRGYLTHLQDDDNTVLLRQAINPLSLIERMDRVYVVSSTLGFEALLAGKPVAVFGLPWYAGWGVSDDRQHCQRRQRRRTVDELFAAAYFHYARYIDPLSQRRGTLFDVIAWLLRQREMAARYPGRLIAVGFPRWRAFNLKPLLSLSPQQLHFSPSSAAAARLSPTQEDALLVWGREAPHGVAELHASSGARLLRLEDGFIRSVGLGSDLIPPLSLVMDGEGIYFDPTVSSELERLLNSCDCSAEELGRAEKVRHFILAHNITKYNLEPSAALRWPSAGREVLFVPGQVEDDASVRYGCAAIRTNLDLLQAVRAAHPDAFIVYKPHPDVVFGRRAGAVALHEARRWANHIETEHSVVSCIDGCDAVHTMTSLCGFDALLRGKPVVVYGQPFYAGWGLTEDRMAGQGALARRTRRLSLDELVAGVLLRYPLYWDWQLRGYTECEAVLQQVVARRAALETDGQLESLRRGWIRRQLRKATVLVRAWTSRL